MVLQLHYLLKALPLIRVRGALDISTNRVHDAADNVAGEIGAKRRSYRSDGSDSLPPTLGIKWK